MKIPDSQSHTDSPPQALYLYPYPMEDLSTYTLLNNLRLNVGYSQFSVGPRDIAERVALFEELDRRGVRDGIIRTVARIGYLQGQELRDEMLGGDPDLDGFELFDYDE